MNLFSADLSDISLADIEEFLAIKSPPEQRPSEGLRIDYKVKESADFPQTVAAFANTYGGLLFIGVESDKKKKNVPISLPGEVFIGGDIKARITGKIMSQVTPRPEINIGVAAVLPQGDRFIAVVRVSPGTWPPYQFSAGDRVQIPMRIQDTNRQATLREIELLFERRLSLSTRPDDHLSPIKETQPLLPAYGIDLSQEQPARAFQTWIIRPAVPLRVRLDRNFDAAMRSAAGRHFRDSGMGVFYPPIIGGDTHVIPWRARIVSEQRGALKCTRLLEFTSDGSIRYAEGIDRHDTPQESVSDLFRESLWFLEYAREFYQTRDYWGSLRILQRVDCIKDVQLLATLPDETGRYITSPAISFGTREYGVAKGSSRVIRDVNSLEGDEIENLVLEFMLVHLRQLSGASLDYDNLKAALGNFAKGPAYWFY